MFATVSYDDMVMPWPQSPAPVVPHSSDIVRPDTRDLWALVRTPLVTLMVLLLDGDRIYPALPLALRRRQGIPSSR